MNLALQPVRHNLGAKSALRNPSICAQRASIASASCTFHTLSRDSRGQYRSLFPSSSGIDPGTQNATPVTHLESTLVKSVSKQRTLTIFRINTYEKRGGGGCSPSLRGNRFI